MPAAKYPMIRTKFNIYSEKNPSMPQKLRNGVGTICDVALKYLHPARSIAEKYPNWIRTDRLKELLVCRREEKVVNRKSQVCIVFRHEDFSEELHCVARWVRVKKKRT